MIAGLATKDGTARFIERFPVALENSSYRRFRRMRVASVGLGTYLGDSTPEDDALYLAAIKRAVQLGCNLIDTAISYRNMQSERVVGKALSELISAGTIQRDEILVCSKGGYLPFDKQSTLTPEAYRASEYYDSGLLKSDQCEALLHSLEPTFLANQLEKSRANLGLEGIDIYYLHNPETQLSRVQRDAFHSQLKTAFEFLESAVKAGKIGCYGLATWNGFRVGSNDPNYLCLHEIVKIAQQVGGEQHNFAAIQLPLNLTKTEAVALGKQPIPGNPLKVSTAKAASEFRIALFASASLDQAKLTKFLPAVVKQHFKKLATDTQYAVQFSRSCTGVVSALVGMRQPAHVDEVLGIFKFQPDAPENFVRLFESPDKSLVR